jgi:hypothetical protein
MSPHSSRPRVRTLVRHSQFSRSEQEFLDRAYELVLPVLRRALTEASSVKSRVAGKGRRRLPQTQIGG